MSTINTIQDAAQVGDASPANDSLRQELLDSLNASRRFECTDSADHAVTRLNLISEIDQLFTEKQQFWTRWLIGFGIGSVAAVVITAFAARLELGATGLILVIPCVLAFLFGAIQYWRAGKLNFEDRRHKIPSRLVQYLKTDIPPDRPVEMEVDFRHYRESSEFQTGKSGGGFFSGIKKTDYEVPWFNLRGQLYDGSKFRLKIVQCAKRKEKKKRKSTKVTETFCDKYNLIVAVKPARYPGLAKFQQLIASAKPISELKISMAKVEGNRITIQGISPPRKFYSTTPGNNDPYKTYSADPALQLFLACYHCLGQCRTV